MAQRYFLKLAYCGAPFHGWQSQPNAISVQATIEKALALILRKETPITGAGRTDTGVNAATMYAHFDTDEAISDHDSFIHRLNSIMGRDIVAYSLIPVAPDAHARFDATSRTYKYFVNTVRSPFKYPFSWYCHHPLDFDKMNSAATTLFDYIDFTSFSKLHTDVKTNNCHITHALWTPGQSHDDWVFTITADRFLRNMVRAIVGTLVEVGRKKISETQFREIIEKKDRCAAGISMPGNALFLWNVTYPYIK